MPIAHFEKIIKLLKQIKHLTTINSNEYINLENTISGKLITTHHLLCAILIIIFFF